MNYAIHDKEKATSGEKHALAAMTIAFCQAMGSHDALLSACPETVADTLLATWEKAGYLEVPALPLSLYQGGRRFPGFPYTPDALLASKRPLAEAWAVLVRRGDVAHDIFSGRWFVTRAGAETAAKVALRPAA